MGIDPRCRASGDWGSTRIEKARKKEFKARSPEAGIGDAEQSDAARFQHAEDLRKCAIRLHEMLKHFKTERNIT